MASAPGLEKEVHLEYTIRKPEVNCEEHTRRFYLRDKLYYFCLSKDHYGHYGLSLLSASNSLFSVSFHISLGIVKGPYTYFRQSKLVTLVPKVVWGKSLFDINRVIPDFGKTPSVTFGIDITYPRDAEEKKRSPNTDDKTTQTLSYLDNHFHFKALSTDFAKLLDGGCSSDVEITCGDRSFNVHKNILSTRSEVFAAMLRSSMVEGRTGRVTIQDVEPVLFQQFLRYLYSGVLPALTADTARIFYVVADKYAVVALKKQCASFLSDSLTRENACETLILADQHSDADFRESVISYILQQKILLCEDLWEGFCENQPKLSIEVYKRFCKVHSSPPNSTHTSPPRRCSLSKRRRY